MNFKYLLILRFALVNIIGIVFILVYTQGYIQRAMNADITNVILLIFVLFFCRVFISNIKNFLDKPTTKLYKYKFKNK